MNNPKGTLRPNQYVRARLKGAVRPAAILVPLGMLDGIVDATIDDIARACNVTPALVRLALGEPW